MKFILLLFSLILSFNCFSQSDTIPNPDIEIVFNTEIIDKKEGSINYIPTKIAVRARGNKDFCSNYPWECRYQVSKFEICILDKNGIVKSKTECGTGECRDMGSGIKKGDKIRINVFEVTRVTKLNKRIPFLLKKEFLFRIE
jgi:hypothetical protein